MADRYSRPRLNTRPWRNDHEWPARVIQADGGSIRLLAVRAGWNLRDWQQQGGKALDEALDLICVVYQAYQRQLRRQSYLRRSYQKQLRRERQLRRIYQGQLRDERSRRREYQLRLRRERSRCRAYEEQLQRQRIYYEQQIRANNAAHGNALYGAKVARLLTLALCSESDGEATTALVKARALHRMAA